MCNRLDTIPACGGRTNGQTSCHGIVRATHTRRAVKIMLKPRLAAATGRTNTHMWDFPDVIKFRVAAHTISDKAIRFQHPDYNPDWAQKLISSFTSRYQTTRNISSKSMHAFLSNLANRQTDRRGQTHLPPPLSEVMKITGTK